MRKGRIDLADTPRSAIVKMAECNPGAMSVLAACIHGAGGIDPDDFARGMGPLLSLDTLHIYGSRIWMLYKDVCGEDLRVMVAVLRASQLGFVADADLERAIDNGGQNLDLPALVPRVESRLPRFAKATP